MLAELFLCPECFSLGITPNGICSNCRENISSSGIPHKYLPLESPGWKKQKQLKVDWAGGTTTIKLAENKSFNIIINSNNPELTKVLDDYSGKTGLNVEFTDSCSINISTEENETYFSNNESLTSTHIRPGEEFSSDNLILKFLITFSPIARRPLAPDKYRNIRFGAECYDINCTEEQKGDSNTDSETFIFGSLKHPSPCAFIQHQSVGQTHAIIIRKRTGLILLDKGTPSGTFVNGLPIIAHKLENNDLIQIGPVCYYFHTLDTNDGQKTTIKQIDRIEGPEITVNHLAWSVKDKETKSTIPILSDITFSIGSGELVGLIGPSGSGKSSLLKLLRTEVKPSGGTIKVNGNNVASDTSAFRLNTGYVPQYDDLHGELTGDESLFYSGLLRSIEKDTLPEKIWESLKILDLTETRDKDTGTQCPIKTTRIKNLSGGQRKRISIGQELLARPGIMFLDEPTSGLDPKGEREFMRTLRRLSGLGQTILCTTHVMTNLELFDKIAILNKGELIYSGTPEGIKQRFNIETFPELYDKLGNEGSEIASVSSVETPPPEPAPVQQTEETKNTQSAETPKPLKPKNHSFFRQMQILMSREFKLFYRNIWLCIISLALPVVIPFLLSFVQETTTMLFLNIVAVCWLMTNSVLPSIIDEKNIFRHEALLFLKSSSYLSSKVSFYGILSFLQALLFVLSMLLFRRIFDADLPESGFFRLLAVFWLMGLVGNALGFLISTFSINIRVAQLIVPLVILFQLVFSVEVAGFGKGYGIPSAYEDHFKNRTKIAYDISLFTFSRYGDILTRKVVSWPVEDRDIRSRLYDPLPENATPENQTEQINIYNQWLNFAILISALFLLLLPTGLKLARTKTMTN